jgi:MoaA/NifB/PqqE/SkfB family radical SAM enzyme
MRFDLLLGGTTLDVRLHGILSSIEEEIRKRSGIGVLLPVLEASKQPIFECLREGLHSPTAAQAVTLKILNLCLAKYHFLARSSTVLSRPFGLIIDPSNACNLACPGCVHSTHVKELQLFSWGKGLLSESRLGAFLANYGPYAIHANFCNYGEPLINPDTPKYIRLAKRQLVKTMLSTSLSLGRFDAEAYAESGLDYMLVSIDGATQPVYERFRRNGRMELACDNIRKLVEAKRKVGKRTPVIAWRFLTFEHNVHEIPLAIERAHQLGVDQFLTLAPYDVSWDDPDIRAAGVQPINLLFETQPEACIHANWNPFPDNLDADTIGREFERSWSDRPVGPENPANGGSTCHWLYKSITMDAGGRIIPCCAAPRPDIDLHFSDFDGSSRPDVFNSDKHRLSRLFFADSEAYRRAREAGQLERDPHCVRCEWNKETPNAGPDTIIQYFKHAGQEIFNPASLSILSSW